MASYTEALTEALEAMDVAPADGAAVRLAHGYAEALDEAAVRLAYAEPLKAIRQVVEGTEAEHSLVKIEAALAVHSTMSDLGPKLLAALDALAMTPRGRTAVTGKGGGTREPTGNALDELRERRRARLNTAAAVDPGTA